MLAASVDSVMRAVSRAMLGGWAFPACPRFLRHCARKCAREHPRTTHFQPSLANETKKNPSASSPLTEGLQLAPELMRPLLCHLSYAAASGPDEESYRLTGRESSQSRPRRPRGSHCARNRAREVFPGRALRKRRVPPRC